tara:strand:+ start:10413 stop:12941 length:2529 start_codon:yes stop_codon:yes gene_type:complete
MGVIMSSKLPLLLARYIAVQPKANKLSLPLDRNLGDITRYKYVLAHTLPLRLERVTSDQSSASALKLGMYQPLGAIAPPIYFVASGLPLPLTVAVSTQPLSSALPLNMSRNLGTAIGVPFTPPDNNDVNIGVVATAVLTLTANASVSVSDDEKVGISVTAIANITPVASAALSTESLDVAVTITATATLNPTANATASYDANNPRLTMLDVSSDMQDAKLQAIDKRSGFEANDSLKHDVNANWQQSKLVGTDNQARFEANEQLTSSSQVSFEQSKLIGDSNKQGAEYQTFIASKSQLQYEQSKRISYSNWYSFEAMAKRQIERAIKSENGKLLTDKISSYNEYGYLLNTRTDFLIETARLPFSKLRYVPPPLSQTVILKEQIIEGWECGSGALRHYIYYNSELPLPMTRRIADRGASGLALTMPRSTLVLSAIEADALPNRPCKRKTLAVNPTLDVVTCQPKVFGKSSGMAVTGQATLNAIAWLSLLIDEKADFDVQGVIFVTNSVSLVRSDDGREIKLLGFSVGIDNNSYAWSFSATVPLSELSKVDTAHEQRIGVDFTCNGNLWRFILDDCSDSVSFGESSLTIKGKSRAMLLAHPYAQQRGFKYDTAMSARQIAEDELNRFGVPSGFTLDWQLAGVNGWQVPANTYSYSNKTPVNSLQWIAEAAGGFINADMSADILHVLAHYPVPSWEWAAQTPSINLPISLITSRSRGRINKPAYNGVTIYGENDNGIGALIKRTGTSGGYQPPMVTSDLMTDTAAAISRGKMILSDTGDIGNIGISMPLVANVGVLKPSTLIGVNDGEQWVGMVRGTTITGRLSSNRALEIDQSIDVERHFDKEIV